MKRLLVLTIVFIFLCSACVMAEEVSLTLQEVIAIALRDNRDMMLKAEDVKKAKAKIAESKSALFPTLTVTSSLSQTKDYYAKDLTQTTSQATLKQYLYKGGKTINSIEQNKYKLAVSHALLDKTKLELILSVTKAFYTLLLANDFCDLNKKIIDNSNEHYNSILERYKNGHVSENGVLEIEASLSDIEQAYEESKNQVASTQLLLNNLLYLDTDTVIRPDAEFSYESIEVAYDEAFLKTMENRPEIRQYEAQTQSDKKAIEIAKADTRPNIYASWDYYKRSHSGLTPTKNGNDYSVIGVTLSWPIFDGWATKAKVEQAIIDLQETQLLKEKTMRDIALELKTAYLDLKNAIYKIRTAESDEKIYQDNQISVAEQYQRGIASQIDKSDANLQYDISLFNKKQAIYDYVIAKSSFDKATGGL